MSIIVSVLFGRPFVRYLIPLASYKGLIVSKFVDNNVLISSLNVQFSMKCNQAAIDGKKSYRYGGRAGKWGCD